MNIDIFRARQKDSYSTIDTATRSTNLLIIGNYGSGSLVVDDKREVGLVVSHAQRHCCHKNIDLIIEQLLFKVFPVGIIVFKFIMLDAAVI